jgi:cobalt-zinc-cadmium efflux system outer membrane protein
MNKFWLPLGLAVLFGMSFSIQAQTANALSAAHSINALPNDAVGLITRERAIDLALQNNPEIASATWEVKASEGALRQAGVIPNPELSASLEDTRYSETRTTTVQISQPLELGGKRAARIAAAERARDLAITELQAKRAEIYADVASTFYGVVSAQERLRLAKESVEVAKRATIAASKRVEAGKISPVEETRAQVAESRVRVELAQAESELVSARHRLAALWGAPQARFERATGAMNDLPAIPEWETLSTRLAQSPTLARAQIELARRRALVRLERSRRIPNVTVSVGVTREEELGRNQAVVDVSVPLPLFDRNQGNVQEAASRAYKAQDELAATSIQLENALSQAYARLQSTRQEAELFQKEILPGAQSAYDAAVKGFEFGKFSFLDVLDAQRTLFQATSQYLQTLGEAHKATADIERIVGFVDPSK